MHEERRKKLSAALLAVLLGTLSWLYVCWEREVEKDLTVPVVVTGVPAGAVIAGVPASLSLTVAGPAAVIASLDRFPLSSVADLRMLTGSSSFPDAGKTVRLPRGVRIVRVSPAAFVVNAGGSGSTR